MQEKKFLRQFCADLKVAGNNDIFIFNRYKNITIDFFEILKKFGAKPMADSKPTPKITLNRLL